MSTPEISTRNALIIKISLFLNYLQKDDHPKLIHELKNIQTRTPDVDVLKVMLNGRYIDHQDFNALKKICIGFARAHQDSRLGALCTNFGFLTQSNLDLALDEQKRLAAAGTHIMLGDLLVDAGMISGKQRNLLLQKQKFEGLLQNKPGPEPSTDEPEYDTSNMRELREADLIFLISNDGLNALMKKTDKFDETTELADLKFILERAGLIYGVTDDDDLQTFIRDPNYKTRLFNVANGLEPVDGRDAQIIYLFERDYLKPGELSQDGTIDFKERGEIPFVSKGDILAEKIPPTEGKDGVNVYGDAIPRGEAMDISFNLGKGVRESSDGLKVISDTEGNPKVKPDGEISVNDAYFIEGDVDYTTGHIKFDKNVYITGSIKNGFRVEAIDVVANTIDGGMVKAEGDVFIQNGVTESTIEAKGGIKAGFMHRSKAACLGDMNVVKEIVDTDILLEGTFEMRRGRMFSSSLCAKGGAKIYSIGSEKANPSSISVGASVYLKTELKNIDKIIERQQNILEGKTIEKNKAETELAVIQKKLENIDKSKADTLAMIEEIKNQAAKPDTRIDAFNTRLEEAGKKSSDLTHQQELLETRLKKINNDIAACAAAVKKSVKEKFNLKRLNQSSPPKPILDVDGKIVSGTRVAGCYANMIVRETLTRSRIMEMSQTTGTDGTKRGWEMIITTL